jgi:hypothetical protein
VFRISGRNVRRQLILFRIFGNMATLTPQGRGYYILEI